MSSGPDEDVAKSPFILLGKFPGAAATSEADFVSNQAAAGGRVRISSWVSKGVRSGGWRGHHFAVDPVSSLSLSPVPLLCFLFDELIRGDSWMTKRSHS